MLRENDIKLFLYENCAVFRSQVLFIGIIEYICAIYNAENKIVNHVRAKLFTKIYSWLSITQHSESQTSYKPLSRHSISQTLSPVPLDQNL